MAQATTAPSAQGSLACQQHTPRPLGSITSMAPAGLLLQLLAGHMRISNFFDTEPVTFTILVKEDCLDPANMGRPVLCTMYSLQIIRSNCDEPHHAITSVLSNASGQVSRMLLSVDSAH